MPSSQNTLIYNILKSRLHKDTQINAYITYNEICSLIKDASAIIKSEPILLRIDPEINIVGDIHGNIDDLIRIFETHGYPSESRYLFLGDYIDRGKNGLEVMILILALKVKYPQNVYMLRGNHETNDVPKIYGFLLECTKKYGGILFHEFVEFFKYLPIAAVVGNSILCVHGGISPELKTLNEFNNLKKIKNIQENKIISDILWSDPKRLKEQFKRNSRGSGVFYNEEALSLFLQNNSLKCLIRSHEYCNNGIDIPFDSNICYTIFSNTNYNGLKNEGATIYISNDNTIHVHKFCSLPQNDFEEKRIIFPPWLFEEQKYRITIDLYHILDEDSSLIEPMEDIDLSI